MKTPYSRSFSRATAAVLWILCAAITPNASAATPAEPEGDAPPLNPAHLRPGAPTTPPDDAPPPPPGKGPATEVVVAAAPEPEGATTTTPSAESLTAENMATADKPKGFRYSIIRDATVDDVTDTILYLRKKKTDKHTKAVPIPKDRKLLGDCIAGGALSDLVKGTVVTVKFDPKGVVKPEIIIQTKVTIEVLDNASVLDRGGSKLYVMTADKERRGFQIEGGAKAWKEVVVGGKSDSLVAGAKIRLEHDPSGRQPLKITILSDPKAAKKSKGCGCSALGPRSERVSGGSLALLGLLMAVLLIRRDFGLFGGSLRG